MTRSGGIAGWRRRMHPTPQGDRIGRGISRGTRRTPAGRCSPYLASTGRQTLPQGHVAVCDGGCSLVRLGRTIRTGRAAKSRPRRRAEPRRNGRRPPAAVVQHPHRRAAAPTNSFRDFQVCFVVSATRDFLGDLPVGNGGARAVRRGRGLCLEPDERLRAPARAAAARGGARARAGRSPGAAAPLAGPR